MAADYARMTENLLRFYDFSGKVVLYVGAAGRQLLPITSGVRKLIAIDQNAEALQALKNEISARGLGDYVEVIGSKFEEVNRAADVVYFEFCLHETEDPRQALQHAKKLAPDIVIYDHSPGSEWIFYGAEEGKVQNSAQSMQRFEIRRSERFSTEQRFNNFGELLEKVRGQGPTALERIQRFASATHFVIPMLYELHLL